MPRLPDKIIIDDQRITGENQRVKSELIVSRILGDEVKELGIYNETDSLIEELGKLCYPKIQADRVFYDGLVRFNNKLNEIVSKHTHNKQP